MTVQIAPERVAMADRTYVSAAMSQFAGKGSRDWLSLGHPCRDGNLPRSWGELANLGDQLVVELIAASAPNHCLDGWSNAARALSSLTAGDPHGARHFAYYAQLRAAMCMLANVGVGIFNTLNVAVDGHGRINCLDPKPNGNPPSRGLGTHSAVWDALEIWVSQPAQAKNFLKMVHVRGSSIDSLIRTIWAGYDASATASLLIATWGVDLQAGRDDKGFRNTSSYQPHAFNPLPTDPLETAGFFADLWSLFAPNGANSFDYLDRHLIRRLLQSQHDLIGEHGGDYGAGSIADKYDRLPEPIQSLAPKTFLTTSALDDTPQLLKLAEVRGQVATPNQMIARALLLLRVATAFTNSNFVDSGLAMGGGGMRPWLDEMALARGFWPDGAPVEELSDLWLDVELDLADYSGFAEIDVPPTGMWLAREAKRFPTITETERIGLWSLST